MGVELILISMYDLYIYYQGRTNTVHQLYEKPMSVKSHSYACKDLYRSNSSKLNLT